MANLAHLTVEIKGTVYGCETFNAVETGYRVARLTKADGTAYDVTMTPDRLTCDCPDWTRRHADLPYSEGCKHCKAMVETGLMTNTTPWSEIDESDAEPAVAVAPVAPLAPLATQPKAEGEDETTARKASRQVSLVEKYRPRSLNDLVGQDEAVYQLREFCDAPSETAFLFDGDTGVGKTSAALALAYDLGCDVKHEELGGVYTIAAGNQLADDVRETLRSLSLRPLFGSGWKVLIVNECDRMSEAVAYLWLDALEHLPMKCVVVFSTNKVEKLPRRFVTRCERMTFRSDAESIGLATQARVNEVWMAETGRTDAPKVADLDGAIENGQVSIRACLQALNSHVRRALAEPKVEAVEAEKSPGIRPSKPRGRKPIVDGIDWSAYARRYEAGESYRAMAVEAGVKPTTMYNRVKSIGKRVTA